MKKKILLAIFICTIVGTAHAQIKKGAVLLGGSVGFSTGSANNTGAADQKNTNVNISPAFGKAIRDNLVIGADISFGYNKTDAPGNYTQKTNTYGAGFFVRKYKELGKGFYLFGQTRAGMSYDKTDYNSLQQQGLYNYTTKGLSAQISIYPGVAYAASKKLQLEAGFNNLASITFNHAETTTNNGSATSISKQNNLSLGSNLSSFSGFTVGFRVFLN